MCKKGLSWLLAKPDFYYIDVIFVFPPYSSCILQSPMADANKAKKLLLQR